MAQPIPPSNFKTKDGDVRDDLRRVRVYLEELNDWLTDNVGDPNALTSVTGDLRYLKRAAADFTSFTAKTVPASADVLLLESAVDAFAKRYATLAQLGFASIYGSGSVPLWVPPAARGLVADAMDDEFDSTTIDPAWQFRDTTTGPTNRTPNFGALTENVDITGATTVPNVALHTQGRRSWMFVQTTTTGPAGYIVYKPFTWAAGKVYWARAVSTYGRAATGTGTLNLSMYASSGGFPDTSNRALIFYDRVNATYRWTVVNGGVATNVAINISEGAGLYPYVAMINPAGVLGASANWYGEFFTDDGLRLIPSGIGTANFTWTPAFIGFGVQQTPTKPNVFGVDFIRANTGHPLFHL